MRFFVVVLSIVLTTLLHSAEAGAKTKKKQLSPPLEEILEEKGSGLVLIVLSSQVQNYELVFQKFDPESGQLKERKRKYRIKNYKDTFIRMMTGNRNHLNLNPGYEQLFFLLDEGTYIIQKLKYQHGNSYFEIGDYTFRETKLML